MADAATPQNEEAQEEELIKIPRVASGAYWGAEGWDPEARIYVGAEAGLQNHLVAVQPKKEDGSDVHVHSAETKAPGPDAAEKTPPPAGEQPIPAADGEAEKPLIPIKRVDSGTYWGADSWDPEARVYVGAALGLQNHLVATEPIEQTKVTGA
mmetsp:Transcript_63928/g.187530  ORF Transcript_63928/g.187530 Transcript_63928/m.187530 type:complete len:153 (-) Transcript_63928:3-461(-)